MVRACWAALAALALIPSVAGAQAFCNGLPCAPDGTPIDVASLAQRVTTLQAQACLPSSTMPPSEAVAGSAGSAATCRRADAVQPRITRAGIVTTDATGAYSITWSTPLPAAPVTLPIPMLPAGSTEPIICLPATSTTTGATGRCWMARTMPSLLTSLPAIAGYDVFGAGAASVSVQVLAIPTTQ